MYSYKKIYIILKKKLVNVNTRFIMNYVAFLIRMSFVDFVRNFTHLELVHIGPDDWLQEPSLQPRKPWRAVLAKRRWRLGYNAGGGPDFVGENKIKDIL